MIYATASADEALHQGEVIDRCPLLSWEPGSANDFVPTQMVERVIILSQACDLENAAKTRVTVAVVHQASDLVEQGILTAGSIRDNVRRHKIFGWYFLPAGDQLSESIVDLHDLHTIPRDLLEQLAGDGHRVCRLVTPFREHLAQHFSVTYSRIGLPEPYETE